jgi:hypothetical protein
MYNVFLVQLAVIQQLPSLEVPNPSQCAHVSKARDTAAASSIISLAQLPCLRVQVDLVHQSLIRNIEVEIAYSDPYAGLYSSENSRFKSANKCYCHFWTSRAIIH